VYGEARRAWRMTVVTSLRGALLIAGVSGLGACSGASPAPKEGPKAFVGSAQCESCHKDVYARWKDTLMANVIRDPKAHPAAILGDFSKPDPLVTFTKDDVAFTYGSKWKQRYYTRIGDEYFVFPAQWDVRNKMWRPYYVRPGTDWWPASTPRTRCSVPRDRSVTAATP
jgi:hypothetical protein